MSEVMRYRQCKDTGEPIQEMMIHTEGEWVEYDTVADLERQLAETRARVRELEEETKVAFVQGAKWWEYRQNSATMWQSDQTAALREAMKRQKQGTIGKES